MLPQLARFTDAKTLTKAGVPAALSKDLLKRARAGARGRARRGAAGAPPLGRDLGAGCRDRPGGGRGRCAQTARSSYRTARCMPSSLRWRSPPAPARAPASTSRPRWSACGPTPCGGCPAASTWISGSARWWCSSMPRCVPVRLADRATIRRGSAGGGCRGGGDLGRNRRRCRPARRARRGERAAVALPHGVAAAAGMDGIHASGCTVDGSVGRGSGSMRQQQTRSRARATPQASSGHGMPHRRGRTYARSLDTLRVFEFDDEVVALARVSGVSGGFEAVRFSLPIGSPCWIATRHRRCPIRRPSRRCSAIRRHVRARSSASRCPICRCPPRSSISRSP